MTNPTTTRSSWWSTSRSPTYRSLTCPTPTSRLCFTLGRRAVRLLGAHVSRARVVAVETGALEDDAHGVEDLAELALAGGALGQRGVGKGLHLLELLATLGAGVLIRGHRSSGLLDAEPLRRLALALKECQCCAIGVYFVHSGSALRATPPRGVITALTGLSCSSAGTESITSPSCSSATVRAAPARARARS